MIIQNLYDEIFQANVNSFESLALKIFAHQYEHNSLYRQYAELLNKSPQSVKTIADIPFLPVSFFKTHEVLSSSKVENSLHFESSTTTGQIPSMHFISDPLLYQRSFRTAFESFFGEVSDYVILGLLPSYLERGHSSLVYMVDHLIRWSGQAHSGFYLHNQEDLHKVLVQLEAQNQKTLLFGVTYALLDFAEQFPMTLFSTRIIETGGMKGRREELTRTEVHQCLKHAFGLQEIFSEYGMTELLSQAYSLKQEIFVTPSWMKMMVRELNDPMQVQACGKGALNIIDLANVHSCSFLATDDYGEIQSSGEFKILGRLDHSELRGCSLLTLND